MYDARAYWDATQPPIFIAPNGKKYVGRVLSIPEWAPLREILTNSSKGEGPAAWSNVHGSMMTIVDTMFPRPWWKVWERKVSSWLQTLPPLERMKAVWDFMQSQGKAYGKEWGVGAFPGTIQSPTDRTQQEVEAAVATNEPDVLPTAGSSSAST